MASIQNRGKSWGVTYYFTDNDGNNRQKQETFKTEQEAIKRKKEVEYLPSKGKFVPPSDDLISTLMEDFVHLYGRTHWSCSTFSTNTGLIRNYVLSIIGDMKLKHANAKRMDEYFTNLREQKGVPLIGKKKPGLLSDRIIREIHILLKTAFSQGIEWGMVGANPITKSSKPSRGRIKPDVLVPSDAKILLEKCENKNLLICLHLALGCSMRVGEILGLKWKNITFGKAEDGYIDSKLRVEEQLQRVTVESLETILDRKSDIRFIFPDIKQNAKSKLVLKSPKTNSSIRDIWIPKTVVMLLLEIKKKQDKTKRILGDAYQNFDLVVARDNGRPYEESRIRELFVELTEAAGVPDVTFHSLRHTSTTVKLLISNGDIKTVQGDTGHAQAKMVTDTYAEILDVNRKKTAQLFDKMFYRDGEEQKTDADNSEHDDSEDLAKLFADNPEAAGRMMDALLKANIQFQKKEA